MDFNKQKIKRVFTKKLAVKSLGFEGPGQIFPANLKETLKPYWERELGRLVSPLPDMKKLLDSLKETLKFL